MTNYYVKTGEHDSAPGTKDRPWEHPSYAALQAVAGDTIYLMDGTWYDEYVVFANSGTESNPITMTAYSGTPTFDGNGHANCIICDEEYVHIKTIKILDYTTIGIKLTGSYNQIYNCDIGYITQSAVNITSGSHHNTVENSKLHHTTHNILQFSGSESSPSHHHSIINNEIYHSSNPGHMMIDLFGAEINDIDIIGNDLHNEGFGQSAIYSHRRPSDPDGLFHRINILNNKIHHTWRGIFVAGFQDSIISKNNIHDHAMGLGGSADLSNMTGCGNTFYGNTNYDVWLTVDGVKLSVEDFTDPCDGEETGSILGKVIAKTTGLGISGVKITADGYETTTE